MLDGLISYRDKKTVKKAFLALTVLRRSIPDQIDRCKFETNLEPWVVCAYNCVRNTRGVMQKVTHRIAYICSKPRHLKTILDFWKMILVRSPISYLIFPKP